jgi:hypothetical protein
MAVQKVAVKKDDFGSAGAATTVTFSFDGNHYEIDLNKRNRETFERHMQHWIDAGRKRNYQKGSNDLSQVREWAKSEGLSIGDRGRVSAEMLERFIEARSTKK